jgi:hypothetical protein
MRKRKREGATEKIKVCNAEVIPSSVLKWTLIYTDVIYEKKNIFLLEQTRYSFSIHIASRVKLGFLYSQWKEKHKFME